MSILFQNIFIGLFRGHLLLYTGRLKKSSAFPKKDFSNFFIVGYEKQKPGDNNTPSYNLRLAAYMVGARRTAEASRFRGWV